MAFNDSSHVEGRLEASHTKLIREEVCNLMPWMSQVEADDSKTPIPRQRA
jgi:hypothetical protein